LGDGIIPPRPRYVGLELRLAGLNPGRIVTLGELTEECPSRAETRSIGTPSRQLNREGVAEPVWVAIASAGDLTQAPERATPVAGERVLRSAASPEPVALADVRARFERVNHQWRKRDVHRCVGLLGLEERRLP
jgi:hypothetical protein